MVKLQTEVLVIGGGATGTGVLRDLSMRGFDAILVEKDDLAGGTTGRFHGLLHSGGRYAVKDPQAAKECFQENRILRRIMPHCIEDTGGFFVVTPWDDPEYAEQFLSGCRQASIPVEEISIHQALSEEPFLNPKISQCFRVPDAAADSFLAANSNADSARQYGSRILNYHKVSNLLQSQDYIVGARCLDRFNDEIVDIHADMVVNATGAWAGKIAATAGISILIAPGKGILLAINHRMFNTVINRCRIPSDGDIIVPSHTVAIIGTTDTRVSDPDKLAIQPWEVDLMLAEGSKLSPGLHKMRILRAWAGVRPLYQEKHARTGEHVNDRDVTRSYVLLNHETRDGISGFITITSGKWTTYRKMAQATVDLICEKLGVDRPSRTHLEPLPDEKNHGHHYPGMRLAIIEKNRLYDQLICECELATYKDVSSAITHSDIKTIDDIRRLVRLGMGPCQGGFCTFRVAGIWHKLRKPPAVEINARLHDFLQERWKGQAPILWGEQLRQARLNELIYLSVLNADHLPTQESTWLRTTSFANPDQQYKAITRDDQVSSSTAKSQLPRPTTQPSTRTPAEVLVIGAGLSGLIAAWQAAERSKHIRLISKGFGALYWHTGCIDLLGYHPITREYHLESPIEILDELIHSHPQHPYALVGINNIDAALMAFIDLCAQSDYPFQGSLNQNWLLPTALGAVRPTCLAPKTMVAGDLRRSDPMLIVGFSNFSDFYPELIADNLHTQGLPTQAINIDLPTLTSHQFITGRVLADLFDTPDFRKEVISTIKKDLDHLTIGNATRIGFPAVLGLTKPMQVQLELEESLGYPVFEIPTLPPSIPGIRLDRILQAAINKAGGRIFKGMEVSSTVSKPIHDGINHLETVWTEAASRSKSHKAGKFVLATGGILGGGVSADYSVNGQNLIRERIFDLPVTSPKERDRWLDHKFLGSNPHPVFRSGIRVNADFQPISPHNNIIYDNLFAIGAAIGGTDYLRERSLDGIALVTGFIVGNRL